MSPKDAKLAVKHGADGIIVSNHGGRQLDTAVTPVDVLPKIARVVNKRVPILVDGGIQRGTDMIKVLLRSALDRMCHIVSRHWLWERRLC